MGSNPGYLLKSFLLQLVAPLQGKQSPRIPNPTTNFFAYTLGLTKKDLWGLGAESWFVVASLPFARMIPPLGFDIPFFIIL